jgi:hypothetical protein
MAMTGKQLDRDIAEALRSRKSPLRVKCRPLLFGRKNCEWNLVGSLHAAEFTSRRRSDEFAIVHPSTKNPGLWQVSFFDQDGASRDSQHTRVEDALRQVPPKLWKLKNVA